MSKRSHQNVTIREGTSEKHWYAIAGYVCMGILGLLATVLVMIRSDGFYTAEVSELLGTVMLAMGGVGVLVMPSLFKDAAYVRDTRRGWMPKWWYYIGGPIGAASIVYAAASVAAPRYALMMALYAFIPTIFAAHTYYLYQRHRYLGVP